MPSLLGCLSPKRIVNPYTKELQYVPCGKCHACLKARADKWTKRLQLEAQNWKYVYFFTLTYNNHHLPYVDLMGMDAHEMDAELQASCVECAPFINALDGKVSTFSVRDIQLFVKRVRKNIVKNENKIENRVLRYYIASEYGPTGFRPHYHGLFFTNSDYFSENASQIISQGWSNYSRRTSSFFEYGHTECERVSSTACQYVSAYCTFLSHLPRVLQHKMFKPFALFSRSPAIGVNCIQEEQIQKIFAGSLARMSYKSPDNNKVVSVRLWRCIENQIFPKCKGFDKISHIERIALYGLSACKFYEGNFEKFIECLDFHIKSSHDRSRLDDVSDIVYWSDNYFKVYKSQQLGIIHSLYADQIPFTCTDWFSKQALYRAWLVSKRVLANCSRFNISLHKYVEHIENYYKHTALDNLAMQFQAENDYLSTLPKNDPAHLPYLIDPAFASNDRLLPVEDYMYYKETFGSDPSIGDVTDTPYYKELSKYLTSNYENSRKIRVKNEYLQRHPQLQKIQNAVKEIISNSVNVNQFKPSVFNLK